MIYAFGESINDAKVLKELVSAARPDLPPVQAKPKPIVLSRQADVKKHLGKANEIVRMMSAAKHVCEVVAVVAHRDLDNVEPASLPSVVSADEEALRAALRPISGLNAEVVVTTPAWEMEAWWLMWPEQVAKHRRSWKKLPDRTGRRVDRIVDAKEVLKKELVPHRNAKIPTYSETDSPLIAGLIRTDGVIRSPKGEAVAFKRFLIALDAIGAKRSKIRGIVVKKAK